jgi:glycosyltransferase involved in cell wall biosynthesis
LNADSASLSSYASEIRGIERQKIHVNTSTSKNKNVDLTVVGNVCLNDGIGKQSIDLVESIKNSVSISFIFTEPPKDHEIASLSKGTQRILRRSGKSHKGRVLVFEMPLSDSRSDAHWNGNFWKKYGLRKVSKHQIRIAYSMYESSKIPMSWVDILNSSFDAVAVPDQYLVQVYKDSGVYIPIFVVALGRDLQRFLVSPIKKNRHHPMIFGNFNTCDRRKNTLKLVQAFGDAFGDDPDVQLRLHWRYSFLPKYREKVFEEISSRGLHNVIIDESSLDFEKYFTLFRQTDCLVNISTGEGFSIQPREAMALGIPVIASNNTAQTTVCATGLVRSVPANIEIPSMYPWPGDFGVQYDCKVSDVAEALRDIYEHYEDYLAKSPQCREWASSYDLPKIAQIYCTLIKPQRVVLGSEDVILSDGLMTTSPKLAKKYRASMRHRR